MIRRFYLALRWLFPRDFRDRFEEEILETARQLDSERRGPRAALAALCDLIVTAIGLRFEPEPDQQPSSHRPSSGMESFLQDLRFALRGLRRDPAFTAFAVITLAVGIGANAAMFGIVDRLLLRGPDHVREPGRVVRVYVSAQPAGMRRSTSSTVGHVMFDVTRSQRNVFSAVANYANNESTIGRGPETRPARAGYASGGFFSLLGVRPLLGRFLEERDNDPNGAAKVAVLSQATWRRDFGGRADVIGQTIIVGDIPHTIIGVAPAGFTGADIKPVDVWLPMNLRSPFVTTDWATAWDAQWMQVIGRLAPGVSPAQAAAALTHAYRAAYTGSEPYMKEALLFASPLRTTESGSEAAETRVARWLMGVSIVMLLIVCANVTNLLLARAMRRTREIAIRLALGAGAARLRRMLVVESVALGIAGAGLGLVLAYVIGGLARRTLLTGIVWTSSPVDGRVLAFSMVIAVLAGVFVGLVPAMRAGAVSLVAPLKSGAGDGGGQRTRLRTALTVAQAAMSVALLVGAGLFVRSLHNARTLPLGIEADRALVIELRRASLASIPEGPQKNAERARRRGFMALASEQLRGLPGVEHAAVAVGMPFGNRFAVRVHPQGRDSMPRLSSGGPSISAVSHDYFATTGTRIIRGRAFTRADGPGTERVTIVSATMAKVVWPNANPLGQCLLAISDTLPCARVVGVAEDTHRSALREDPTMHYYIPLGQEVGFGGAVLLVRGAGDPRALVPSLRRELMKLDQSITYAQVETLEDRIAPQMQPWKLGTSVLMAAGLLALLVAVAGIYSVTSYIVTLRRREIGVRVALGATAAQVLRLVLRNGLVTALAGAAIGSLLALAAGRFLEPLLFNQSPRDPVVFGAVSVSLVLSSLLACLIPAMRANRIDPVEALRSE